MRRFTNEPAGLFFSDIGGPDKEELEAAYATIEASRAAITKQKAEALFRCAMCGETTPVAIMEYIQTHWYTTPYGCSSGDYWTPGEGMVACPACDVEHRTNFSPGLADLKESFGTQSDRNSH